LLGEGKTNKQIAEALFRSPNTVKLHVSAILRELNLKSRTQAALLASRLQEEGSNDPLISGVMSWKKTRAAQQQ
jgi:FixJ family two-component response regulator